MSHKAKFAALVLGTLISSQAMAAGGNFYVLAGGGVGIVTDGRLDNISSVSPSPAFVAYLNSANKTKGLYHAAAGFMIDGPWGVETNYYNYASIRSNAAFAGPSQVNQTTYSRAVDLSVIGKAALAGPIIGYARLGLGYSWMIRNNDLYNLLGTSGDNKDKNGLGFAGALGLEWDINEWLFSRLEVSTLTGNAMESNATLNLGVRLG